MPDIVDEELPRRGPFANPFDLRFERFIKTFDVWTPAPQTNPAHHRLIRAKHFQVAADRLDARGWPMSLDDRWDEWWQMFESHERARNRTLGVKS